MRGVVTSELDDVAGAVQLVAEQALCRVSLSHPCQPVPGGQDALD